MSNITLDIVTPDLVRDLIDQANVEHKNKKKAQENELMKQASIVTPQLQTELEKLRAIHLDKIIIQNIIDKPSLNITFDITFISNCILSEKDNQFYRQIYLDKYLDSIKKDFEKCGWFFSWSNASRNYSWDKPIKFDITSFPQSLFSKTRYHYYVLTILAKSELKPKPKPEPKPKRKSKKSSKQSLDADAKNADAKKPLESDIYDVDYFGGELFYSKECVLCLDDKTPTDGYFPCGHICLCSTCVPKINSRECPVCRKPSEYIGTPAEDDSEEI